MNLTTLVRAVTMATGIKDDGETLPRRLRTPRSPSAVERHRLLTGSRIYRQLFTSVCFIPASEDFRWCFCSTGPFGSTCRWRDRQEQNLRDERTNLLFVQIVPSQRLTFDEPDGCCCLFLVRLFVCLFVSCCDLNGELHDGNG